MKRERRLLRHLVSVLFIVCVLPHAHAGIVNTVHNLSVSGTGAIKATSETEICVFCHIPHNSRPGRPLWNHDMPGSAYTMYSSAYLYRMSYSVPSSLGTPSTPGEVQAGTLSRQCLSCHDGTVAVGALYAVRGTALGNTNVGMANVSGTGAIPSTATGYIGTDLRNHHPVGIVYNPAVSVTFSVGGSRSIELVTNPSSTAIKLYRIGASDYVECSSCHDPHLENSKFLRNTSGANLAAKISATCTGCHTKAGWTGSVHQTNASAYNETAVSTYFGTQTVNQLLCMNCHRTHNANPDSSQGTPPFIPLLRWGEQRTCFRGAATSTGNAPCHGTSPQAGGKNIQTAITRLYGHNVTSIGEGVHTGLDVLVPLGGGGFKGLQWSTDKHVECVDCHNPHRAKQGTHAPSGSWYPASPTNTTNNVSNALTGVTGAEPSSWPTAFSVPTTFNTIESSTKEYQICFKCHSYWALRDADGITTYTTASGATVTDQAMEFNPNNKSAHSVVNTLNSQTGSYAPKALASNQMSSPWTSVGNQTMYCSDCHGTDSETTTDPKGPHGSSNKYLLKGSAPYWPLNPGGTLWGLNHIASGQTGYRANWRNELFCANCHPLVSGSTWYNVAHKEHFDRAGDFGTDVRCVYCHVAVPHGAKRSRLIGYVGDSSPYNYNGNSLKLLGYKKPSGPNNYSKQNCYSTQAMCSDHNSNAGGYDP